MPTITPDHPKYGVHNTHCCKIHGCKYGDSDCPVAYGDAPGVICESCDEDKHNPLYVVSQLAARQLALADWHRLTPEQREQVKLLEEMGFLMPTYAGFTGNVTLRATR